MLLRPAIVAERYCKSARPYLACFLLEYHRITWNILGELNYHVIETSATHFSIIDVTIGNSDWIENLRDQESL